MSSAPMKRVAWGKCLCFHRERSGRWRFRFGTKMMVWRPGWGPRERIPAMAASTATRVQSWLEQNPLSIHVPSVKVRKATTKWSGCGMG